MKLQVLFGLSAISMAVAAPSYRVPVSSKRLQATLKTENLMKRARQLEAFSLLTPEKNRVFGSPGHNATVNYIYDTLVKTGKYDVTLQPFVETYSQGTADLTVNGEDIDASYFTYIKTSKVEGSLVAVRGLGCELADYPTELKGNIAIVERGVCPFANKSNFAFQAGAVGAIIYNNGNGSIAGRVNSTGDFVPTAGIQRVPGLALIEKLKAGEALKATLEVNAFTENRTTYNVFAQTKDGDQNNVLAVGSHTDSVFAGPGINDNGSGTIAILEIATKLAAFRVKNAVRFCFWSAEEFGLLGARYYVKNLSKEELDKIRLYLNFDMIASPNYMYGIYDGDGSKFNKTGPAGSAEAEALLAAFFKKNGLPSVETDFSGRSDYGPFLEAGVAAGGLFTGAEGLKTEAEAKLFGGQAGISYDVNYHLKGDTVANLNQEAFITNARAIADSIGVYGRSWESLPPRPQRIVKPRALEETPKELARCGGVVPEL